MSQIHKGEQFVMIDMKDADLYNQAISQVDFWEQSLPVLHPSVLADSRFSHLYEMHGSTF